MVRKVIAGGSAVAAATASISIEEVLAGGWSRRFLSRVGNQRWLATYMQSWRQGGGYEVLIRLPYPELTDWLALVAEVWVAAIGAGKSRRRVALS